MKRLLVDRVVTDNGVQGARFGIEENNKSGGFLGQTYSLAETILPADGDAVAAAKEILKDGPAIIVADLESKDLLAVADLPEAKRRTWPIRSVTTSPRRNADSLG